MQRWTEHCLFLINVQWRVLSFWHRNSEHAAEIFLGMWVNMMAFAITATAYEFVAFPGYLLQINVSSMVGFQMCLETWSPLTQLSMAYFSMAYKCTCGVMNNDHIHSATAKYKTTNGNFASSFAKPPNKISTKLSSYTILPFTCRVESLISEIMPTSETCNTFGFRIMVPTSKNFV